MQRKSANSPLDQASIALLARALAPLPLPRKRRATLRTRVVAAIAAPTSSRIVLADQGEWRWLLPGIAIRFLRVDRAMRTQTSIWRLDPGARIPPHSHRGEEECLILDGSVRLDGREYVKGDYLLAVPGVDHTEFVAPHGALLLLRTELTAALERLAAGAAAR